MLGLRLVGEDVRKPRHDVALDASGPEVELGREDVDPSLAEPPFEREIVLEPLRLATHLLELLHGTPFEVGDVCRVGNPVFEASYQLLGHPEKGTSRGALRPSSSRAT